MQTLELLVSWIVTTALVFVVVLADERRLRDDQLEDAWPPASRDLLLVWLGILALPFHFARTRGRFWSLRGFPGWLKGFAMGLVAAVLVVLVNAAVVTAFDWAVGLPLDD